MAGLLAFALAVALPGHATASSSTSDPEPTRPHVTQQAAQQVSTAKTGSLAPFTPISSSAAVGAPNGPQREVFGFALADSLTDSTVGDSTWDYSVLATVAFFGLHVNDDGTFATDSGWNVWNSSELTDLETRAANTGTRVVVTIILQDSSNGTPHMCSALQSTNAATTVTNTVTQVKAKGVAGVNVDYEGLNGSCGTTDPSWARHAFTSFVANLRAALPGYYISVDTYASSAADSLGFFDIAGLAPSVDSFFVMAYDLEYSNYPYPPINCTSFCLGPTAPLAAYHYNDTSTASQYTSLVPASKVLLGIPYYGRKACVASATPNQYPTSGVVADTYLDAVGEAGSSFVKPGSYVIHRDANDPAGQERWDTWFNTSLNCTRELYWDDTTSLGHKYALVNADNLRGVGIWNLNYGGGATELWSLLHTYFSCPVSINLPASETSTKFSVPLDAGSCSVASFDLQVYDSTLNQGWFGVTSKLTSSSAGTASAWGYVGHTYQFRARAHSIAGVVGAWTTVTTQVSTTATLSEPFSGMYTLDADGGVNSADSPPLATTAYWPGWGIARSAHVLPGSVDSGLVLDGWGGLHPYGAPMTLSTTAYWSGWDIARDFAFLPDGTGGFVLDGYGGLHAFHVNGSTAALNAVGFAYWAGWDIARKVVIFADGKGGYTLDAWGGIHPFGINGPSPVSASAIVQTGYWSGWSIARDIVLVPGDGGHSGYTLDGWGGVHPFHVNGDGSVMPANIATAYWSGWDIARGMFLLPGSATAGYTLDGWGGLHPFGGAPAIISQSYWPGRDIAKCVLGA